MANQFNKKVNSIVDKALTDLKGKVNKEEVNKKIDSAKEKLKDRINTETEEAKKEAANKAIDYVKDATQKVTNQVNNINLQSVIKDTFSGSDFAYLVNDLLDKSIDEIVEDEIKKARQNYNLSNVGQAVALAESYYKQIFDSQFIMTEARNDFSDHLSKSINSVVNDRLYDLQDKLGGDWARKLLGHSKLASTITNAINKEVATVVNAIISDELIANVSGDIVDMVQRVEGTLRDQIETELSDEIEYAQTLRKKVEDKIQLFQEQKMAYEKKLEEQIKKLQAAINQAIQKVEQIIIDEISKVIKIDTSSLNLGF